MKIIKKQLANTNMHSYENELFFPKENKIFKNIYNKRLSKIEEVNKDMIMMM